MLIFQGVYTVDGRHPAPVSPIMVLYIPGAAEFLPSMVLKLS